MKGELGVGSSPPAKEQRKNEVGQERGAEYPSSGPA